ncbi:fimbrial protein [Muribaculum intestinale]|uniref:fimbrial protein n=1 Tax=Muribaculum intestinale TaxID=1796646 RepID=UPI0025A5297F|nr:fimbrial protein [Muribaculum intestinale]
MKFNKLFMLGLLGLTFAACSSDDNDAQLPDKDSKVYVSLSIGTAKSRSLGESAVGKYNTIENLKIMFYDGSEQYVPYAWDDAARAKAIEDLKSDAQQTTITLEGVPASAQSIYIIANEMSNNPIGTGTLSEARATKIFLKNQYKEDFTEFSNESSTLTGLTSYFGKDLSKPIEVELVPITARMEVKNFIAKTAPDTYLGNDIENFNVLGIYMNNFYTEGELQGSLDDNRPHKDYGSVADNYTLAKYTADGYDFMCNEPSYDATNGNAVSAASTTVGEIWKVSPKATTKWWGYSALRGVPPHMVIKLDVKYANIEARQTRFLTVASYKLKTPSAEGKDKLESIERGHAYQIENCTFDATNLTENPYEEAVTIEALVTVAQWTGVPIEPEFN